MQALEQYFARLGFPAETLTNFLACVQLRRFSPNHLLLQPGQTEKYLSFLAKGAVRYYLLQDGREITFDFAFANSFFCAYDSFYSQKPTAIYLQPLTDCELYSISYADLQRLYRTCATANQLGQLATEFLLARKVKRELDLLSKTTQQRYEELVQEQPALVRQIPQKYLASYLGVVPETLSRIRKRIS